MFNPLIRLIARAAGYILAVLLGATIFFLIAAFILSVIPVNRKPDATDNGIIIYIRTNGVHSEFVVPARTLLFDWPAHIPLEHTLETMAELDFIAVGWGDRRFYLNTPEWSDLTFSVAFGAFFLGQQPAMHIQYTREPKNQSHAFPIKVSEKSFRLLCDYILDSFETDFEGHVIQIHGHHYGKHDAFYEATGSFSLFRTCNTWTNNGLKAAGLKACLWTPFDMGIFYQYRHSKSVFH
jgi:uncharacterized protein (TIGR02117 family)